MSATQIIYSLAYFGISFFFFQIQFLTGSAIINLDKIKSPFGNTKLLAYHSYINSTLTKIF